MPTITRRILTSSFEKNFARFFFDFSFQKDYCLWELPFWRLSSVNLCLRLSEQERTIVPFVHDFFRGWNCKSPLLNTVQLLSTDSILPLSSQNWLSSLCDSWLIHLSQSFHSGLCSCASWSSDQCVFLPQSSIFDSLALPGLDQFLVHTWPTRSEAEQNLVSSTCTDCPGHSL